MYKPKPPTERQIAYADQIAEFLNVDFPQTSKDFTKARYSDFITAYVDEYKWEMCANDLSDDDEMLWFQMING